MATAEFSGRAKPSLAEQLKSDWIPSKELPEDQLEALGKSLEKAWQSEIKKDGRRRASLGRSLFNCFGRSFMIAAFWEIVGKCIFGISVAILLGLLVNDIQNYLFDSGYAEQHNDADKEQHLVKAAPQETPISSSPSSTSPSPLPEYHSNNTNIDSNSLTWAWQSSETQIVVKSLALLGCLCGNIIASQYYLFHSTYVGMKCRLACTYLIYRKALRINLLTMESKTSGQIMNLITNDVNKFDSAFYYIQYIYIAPLQTSVIFVLLATFYMGLTPTLVGLVLVAIYLVVQIYLGTLFGQLRNESTLKTDERVRAMGELIDSISIIKMYAWEGYFERQISKMREEELSVLGRVMKLRAINLSLFYGACKLLLMVIFVVYVLMGNTFNEIKVFTALTMTNSMRTYLTLLFPYSVAQLNEMKVSLERIRQFLIQDELITPPQRQPPLAWPVVLSPSSAVLNPFYNNNNSGSTSSASNNTIKTTTTKTNNDDASTASRRQRSTTTVCTTPKRADGSCSICAKFDNNHLLIDRKFAIIFHEVSVSWPKPAVAAQQQPQLASDKSQSQQQQQSALSSSPSRSASTSHGGLTVPSRDQANTSFVPHSQSASASSTTTFSNLTAHIRHHEFVMIVGRVGTGKSSLLMTLLNELPIQSGSIRINGSLSYASQEPWLFAGTIRENITIAWHRQAGRDYKHLPTRLERRYQEILRICCLDRDIQIMPYGDLTQVGERGSALSGGQKARVNLARALFYEADIYLLDDPLSAVDSAVAKHIFDECFKTFLKKKTVLLVTHQVQFSTLAQKVLLLHDSPDFSYGPATKVLHNLLEKYNLLDPTKGANNNNKAAGQKDATEAKLVPVVVNEQQQQQQQTANKPYTPSTMAQPDLPMGEIDTNSLINNGSGGVKSLLDTPTRQDTDDDNLLWTINSGEDYFRTVDSLTDPAKVGGGGGAKQPQQNRASPPTSARMIKSIHNDKTDGGGQLPLKSNVVRSPSLRLLAEASLAADSDKPANLATYLYYRRHAITVSLLVAFLLANFLTQILFNGTDYFLSVWSSSESSRAKSLAERPQLISANVSRGSTINETTTSASALIEYTFPASSTILRQIWSGKLKIEHMIAIYVSIIVLLLVCSFARNMIFFNSCFQASYNIHRELLHGVLYAPMKFFDHNSIGTIMSRFSTDLNILDDDISQTLIDVIEIGTNVCGIIVVTALVSYYNLLPALVVLFVANYFRRQSSGPITQLKQLETNKRSQVISQAMSTLHGLSTIRVFRLESIINRRFERIQNEHTHIWYSFLTGLHRLTRLIDATCMVYFVTLISLTMLLVFNGYVEASLVGLLVSQVIILPGPLQWGARQITELQSLMTSLVRIRDYCKMDSEQEAFAKNQTRQAAAAAMAASVANLLVDDIKLGPAGQAAPPSAAAVAAAVTKSLSQQPATIMSAAAAALSLDDLPDNWPTRGSIRFEQITLSYTSGAEVLHGISFSVEPGERVGVVGRTGAGKSSIVSALFRMTDYRGRILIDDVDIATIRLNDLRRSISIIPQDPILFNGSVRRNLDPFDEHKDETIWSALEAVRLKGFVLELSGGLEGQVAEGGQNFSLGQRQLICLARVILRKNRILILDEATANVDPETDLFIQKTIRDYFQNCTVITIAHRLNTIMDSDRILVMEAGQVKEFDEPHLLLQNKSGTSLLAQMISNTGQQQADRLKRIAERTYTRRHQQEVKT